MKYTKNKRMYNKQSKKQQNKRKQKKTKDKKRKIIKYLGKKTKKYKKNQYGCCKSMKGGGPLFQPFTYVGQQIENTGNNLYNNFYGYNDKEYTIY
jgi:hypothetical protein